MSFYSAYIKFRYLDNNESDDKTCTVSDKKYDEDYVTFEHDKTTYYIRSSYFKNRKVKITYWEF